MDKVMSYFTHIDFRIEDVVLWLHKVACSKFCSIYIFMLLVMIDFEMYYFYVNFLFVFI